MGACLGIAEEGEEGGKRAEGSDGGLVSRVVWLVRWVSQEAAVVGGLGGWVIRAIVGDGQRSVRP